MKILVVEDNPDLLYITTRVVEKMGFTIETAQNGRDSVEKALEKNPNLILMDILMPLMDGRQATRIIRSNPKIHDIPILATTVLHRKTELNSCIEAGCNDYLVKPFSLEQLQGKIKKLLPTAAMPA